jgi:glucose/arabinose dehydrogenase
MKKNKRLKRYVPILTLLLLPLVSRAAVTKAQLAQLKVPPGFHVSVFAEVPNARQMTLTADGDLIIGTREDEVFGIAKAAQLAHADHVVRLAEKLNAPNGVAAHGDSLFVAEISRILRYDHVHDLLQSGKKLGAPVVLREDYPSDAHHGWKYIAFGPDGYLYVPVGAPCNLCQKENPIYASMTRLSVDGKQREIFATGIRNTVGFDFDPQTKLLWFTDNGVDELGDDVPSDELNRASHAGQNFGYPFCHQGDLKDQQFGKNADCSNQGPYVQPVLKLGAHVAALGMKFYNGSRFPPEYKHRVLIAEHGSWNRSRKSGYRVMSVALTASPGKETVQSHEVFIEGWKQGESAWGRPVDILNLPDGDVLVSDDTAGAIYRVTYGK